MGGMFGAGWVFCVFFDLRFGLFWRSVGGGGRGGDWERGVGGGVGGGGVVRPVSSFWLFWVAAGGGVGWGVGGGRGGWVGGWGGGEKSVPSVKWIPSDIELCKSLPNKPL